MLRDSQQIVMDARFMSISEPHSVWRVPMIVLVLTFRWSARGGVVKYVDRLFDLSFCIEA